MNTAEWKSRAERRAEARLNPQRPRRMSTGVKISIWVVIGAALFGVGWWLSRPTPPGQPLPLADESILSLCVSHGSSLSQHIHPHLVIIVDGQERTIPANIGITSSCLRPLHTHDDTGIIHVESPVERRFTLGQFFANWDQPFTPTKVLDVSIDASRQMKLFVNQKEVTTGADTVLEDKTSYAIVVGKAGEELVVPSNYAFPPNL